MSGLLVTALLHTELNGFLLYFRRLHAFWEDRGQVCGVVLGRDVCHQSPLHLHFVSDVSVRLGGLAGILKGPQLAHHVARIIAALI